MEPEEAVTFLINRTRQSDETAAQALAETLGYLPVALEQVGVYIETSQIGFSEYLRLFETHQSQLLSRDEASPYYYRPFTI